ncbi:hypothetical protein FIE12Z_6203 [Fusarium flagelliforme]|uniref:Uncharacterized protein n=1 Tax=Fusarium flagelliforme TaxID=2675880 RepID=A0A395MP26_9HYPO|nr:hypothetical protein FIE12Z_6203 [Fusarium flagelliforme]
MDSCIDISDFHRGDPDPDHAQTLVTVMVYIADEADAGLCEALSFNQRYRRRTQSIFGMSWAPTRDNGWESSCGMERLAKYEIAWADYQLQSRHIHLFAFYVEASYMWTVLNRCNMNVDKVLARRRVQPEPATAEDDEFHHVLLLSPFFSVSHLDRQQPTLFLSYSLPPPLPILPMASSPSTPGLTERFGTLPKDFETDSDVVKSRQPNAVIHDFLGLSHMERWSLGNHLRLWIKLVDQTPAEARDLQIPPEHRRRFGMKLFDGWSTAHGASEIPELPDPNKKENSRIPVNVWSQDLPLSQTAKRKRGNDDDQTTSPARKKGAKAFLSVTKTVGKGDDKIAFEFKDAKFQLATGEFVTYNPSANLVVAKAQSLIRHDAIEVTRTRTFNEQLVITTARNWIVEAARLGLEPGSGLELNPMGEHEPASGAPRKYRLFLCITKRRKEYKNFEMFR